MHIGLLSDTHGYLDDQVFRYFDLCDEIWHAGDIGDVAVIDKLAAFKPVRAVYGNIDGREIRLHYPENLRFTCEQMHVWLTHIGGYPPNYTPAVLKELRRETPDLFVCGHSHILRVMPDRKLNNLLYLNPGATGREGFHHVRTALRFTIEGSKVTKMEAIELGKRGH